MSDNFETFYSKLMGDVKTATDEDRKTYLEKCKQEAVVLLESGKLPEEIRLHMKKLKDAYPGDKKEFEDFAEHGAMVEILDKRIAQMEMHINAAKAMREMLGFSMRMK